MNKQTCINAIHFNINDQPGLVRAIQKSMPAFTAAGQNICVAMIALADMSKQVSYPQVAEKYRAEMAWWFAELEQAEGIKSVWTLVPNA